jgi:hypothetical protein
MTNVLLALTMFMSAALIDFACARQTLATTNGHAIAAANWRAIAYSFGRFGWLVAIKVGMWLLPCTSGRLSVWTKRVDINA